MAMSVTLSSTYSQKAKPWRSGEWTSGRKVVEGGEDSRLTFDGPVCPAPSLTKLKLFNSPKDYPHPTTPSAADTPTNVDGSLTFNNSMTCSSFKYDGNPPI